MWQNQLSTNSLQRNKTLAYVKNFSEHCDEMDKKKAGGMEDIRKVKRTMKEREILLIRGQIDTMRNSVCGTMTRWHQSI